MTIIFYKRMNDMGNKKVCYGDCKVCTNKKECKIMLENIIKEAQKKGYLKPSK